MSGLSIVCSSEPNRRCSVQEAATHWLDGSFPRYSRSSSSHRSYRGSNDGCSLEYRFLGWIQHSASASRRRPRCVQAADSARSTLRSRFQPLMAFNVKETYSSSAWLDRVSYRPRDLRVRFPAAGSGFGNINRDRRRQSFWDLRSGGLRP